MARRQLDYLQEETEPAHRFDARIVLDRLADIDVATGFVAAPDFARIVGDGKHDRQHSGPVPGGAFRKRTNPFDMPARCGSRSTNEALPSSSSISTMLTVSP
jgi:hypothetical protein